MDNMLVVAIMVLGCILINPYIKGADKEVPETEQTQTEDQDSEEEEDEGEGESD